MNEVFSSDQKFLKNRLILLPSEIIKKIKNGNLDSINTESNQYDESHKSIKRDANNTAPSNPPVSQFDNPKNNVQDFYVRGQGTLNETLACFQMLSKLMNLPYRKDAIEKILKETLRRGQAPSLRLCGNIAAGLGLHVSSARVAARLGIRLRTPCLIPGKIILL